MSSEPCVLIGHVSSPGFQRRLRSASRKLRELRMIVNGLLSTDHPVQAQIIPMRRCNLSCTYCNEYDEISDPVPVEEMYRRVDKLAALGTTLIVISGGEPFLHPHLPEVIAPLPSHPTNPRPLTNQKPPAAQPIPPPQPRGVTT